MACHLLIGCGYLGTRVAEAWEKRGDSVAVLTRSPQKAAKMRDRGWDPLVGDVTQPQSLSPLKDGNPLDSLVYAVGHDRRESSPIEEVYVRGLDNVLESLASRHVGRVIYISTTGVYGDAGGDWVDEVTPPAPTRPGGKASLAAEEVLQRSPYSRQGIILRLAGIYGPDRLPYLDLLRRGEPLEATSDGYLNLIHVVDAARIVAILSSGQKFTRGPAIYCVSDGHPVRRAEFYRELAAQLGAPRPQFAASTSSSRANRGATSKKINNRKLLTDLDFNFSYPTYREGIAEIVIQQS